MNERNQGMEPLFRRFAKATDAILAKTLDLSFEELVRQYRQVEADFVEREGGDAFFVLEAKRRIAELILLAAHSHQLPFEVCQNVWNDLQELGFSNIRARLQMSWFYGDCCLLNERFDAGLEILEPILAELHQKLSDDHDTEAARWFYEEQLPRFEELRDGMIALRAGGAEAEAWLALDEARQNRP